MGALYCVALRLAALRRQVGCYTLPLGETCQEILMAGRPYLRAQEMMLYALRTGDMDPRQMAALCSYVRQHRARRNPSRKVTLTEWIALSKRDPAAWDWMAPKSGRSLTHWDPHSYAWVLMAERAGEGERRSPEGWKSLYQAAVREAKAKLKGEKLKLEEYPSGGDATEVTRASHPESGEEGGTRMRRESFRVAQDLSSAHDPEQSIRAARAVPLVLQHIRSLPYYESQGLLLTLYEALVATARQTRKLVEHLPPGRDADRLEDQALYLLAALGDAEEDFRRYLGSPSEEDLAKKFLIPDEGYNPYTVARYLSVSVADLEAEKRAVQQLCRLTPPPRRDTYFTRRAKAKAERERRRMANVLPFKRR